MPLETSDLHQKAVLWPFAGNDKHGQPVVSAEAVEIDVRWNQEKSEATDPNGNTVSLDATVAADRAIKIGSMLWLGCFADIPGTSGVPDEGIMQVRTYSNAADI